MTFTQHAGLHHADVYRIRSQNNYDIILSKLSQMEFLLRFTKSSAPPPLRRDVFPGIRFLMTAASNEMRSDARAHVWMHVSCQRAHCAAVDEWVTGRNPENASDRAPRIYKIQRLCDQCTNAGRGVSVKILASIWSK